MRGTHSIVEGTIGLTVALVLASATGCAGQRAAYEKQVTALEDEVTVLQNANDRLEERIAALELAQATRPKEGRVGGGRPERPSLEVVKLAPEAEADPAPAAEPSAAPDAANAGPRDAKEAPRPLIHGTGEQLETKLPEGPTSSLAPPHSSRAGGGPAEHAGQASRPCTRRART